MKPDVYNKKWDAPTLRHAINVIYSDAERCKSDQEAFKMFERAGRYDCCILMPYLNTEDKVLDFAGGIGRVALPVSKYVKNVTVVDYSKDMINIGREYCKDASNIEFVQNTDNIPFPDNHFDLAYTFLCACHLKYESMDLEYWLSEVGRVLKPGGLMIFDTESSYEIHLEDDERMIDSFKKYQVLSDYSTMIYVIQKVESNEG